MFAMVVLKRRLSPFRALIYSGLILIAFNSFYLINLSFQLCFLASLGLNFIPKLNFGRFSKSLELIYETISTTVFSFLFTLPVILQINGGIYLTGLLINFVVVPFVPLVYFLALFTSLPFIGEFFAIFTTFMERIFYEIVVFAGNLSTPIKLGKFDSVTTFAYFVVIAGSLSLLNFYLNSRKINQRVI
jgi:competence protein ComEC